MDVKILNKQDGGLSAMSICCLRTELIFSPYEEETAQKDTFINIIGILANYYTRGI